MDCLTAVLSCRPQRAAKLGRFGVATIMSPHGSLIMPPFALQLKHKSALDQLLVTRLVETIQAGRTVTHLCLGFVGRDK